MYELAKEEFMKVLPLVGKTKNEVVFVYSVIDGIQPGRIFVDNPINPTVTLIASKGGHYYIDGNISNEEFNQSLITFLLDRDNHANFFDLYTFSSLWVKKLDHILNNKAIKLYRSPFKFDSSKFSSLSNYKSSIPEEFELVRMDEKLVAKYRDEVDSHYKILWNSEHEYVSKGFGFCLLYGDRFASVCNSFYVGGGYAAIDIVTGRDFRGRGLATITCSAFIEHCMQNNLKPSWECTMENLPSFKLATKLGFEKREDFEIYWWHESREVQERYINKYSQYNT
jgi:RimJ/RimL family protein N-acetyltransferase